MSDSLYMVFDVESIGLHGEGFAVGYVVVDRDGTILEDDRYRSALVRARQWIEGAAETFSGSMDCGEEGDLDSSDCVNGDSFCERTRDMNRALTEIDATLGECPK